MLLTDYYRSWIETYKKGSVRPVTLKKYINALSWLEKNVPSMDLSTVNRVAYQNIINLYAEEHEKQTTADFHCQLKSALLDAMEDGMIQHDPTRKVVIKGKAPRDKKPKFLSQAELQAVLKQLNLGEDPSVDWLLLLIAKTGMRFSEAIAVTPNDFDFSKQTVSVSKTWDYKAGGGFSPTKNKSSVRNIPLDWKTVIQFMELVKGLPDDRPIFVVKERIYNSTVNSKLERLCKAADTPVITVHGLRHTHASILLANGVSIASISKRLGHSNMATTQKVYLHIVQEMENKDTNIIMLSMAGL